MDACEYFRDSTKQSPATTFRAIYTQPFQGPYFGRDFCVGGRVSPQDSIPWPCVTAFSLIRFLLVIWRLLRIQAEHINYRIYAV
jgi:hypothetical protein